VNKCEIRPRFSTFVFSFKTEQHFGNVLSLFFGFETKQRIGHLKQIEERPHQSMWAERERSVSGEKAAPRSNLFFTKFGIDRFTQLQKQIYTNFLPETDYFGFWSNLVCWFTTGPRRLRNR